MPVFVFVLVCVLTSLVACTAADDIHPPAIGAITPNRGRPGATVSITGDYFCAQPEPDDPAGVDPLDCAHVGAVSFDTVPANVGVYTDMMIQVEVPNVRLGLVDVYVTVAGRTSNNAAFFVE